MGLENAQYGPFKPLRAHSVNPKGSHRASQHAQQSHAAIIMMNHQIYHHAMENSQSCFHSMETALTWKDLYYSVSSVIEETLDCC